MSEAKIWMPLSSESLGTWHKTGQIHLNKTCTECDTKKDEHFQMHLVEHHLLQVAAKPSAMLSSQSVGIDRAGRKSVAMEYDIVMAVMWMMWMMWMMCASWTTWCASSSCSSWLPNSGVHERQSLPCFWEGLLILEIEKSTPPGKAQEKQRRNKAQKTKVQYSISI